MREDLAEELLIWRPIMEGLVTLAEVKSGDADIIDLLKLNALMDMKSALEQRAINDAKQK